ncbi:MAG: MBL fold metallo-hydrolase [Marinoscillum sp.]
MRIKSLVFNPFYENTYVLWDDTKEGIIIDPGCYEPYEIDEIKRFIQDQQIQVKAIINTHCHIDHVLGNYILKQTYGCPLWIPEGELEVFRSVVAYAPQWGIQRYTEAEVDKFLIESDVIQFGNTSLKSILVPGHSPGHLVFYNEKEKKLIGGDVLFRESIGRTDLPGGNHSDLLANIKNKLYTLNDDVEVFPGHGPSTTIGFEKKHNPFVKA